MFSAYSYSGHFVYFHIALIKSPYNGFSNVLEVKSSEASKGNLSYRQRKARDLVLALASTGDLGCFDDCVNNRIVFYFLGALKERHQTVYFFVIFDR